MRAFPKLRQNTRKSPLTTLKNIPNIHHKINNYVRLIFLNNN